MDDRKIEIPSIDSLREELAREEAKHDLNKIFINIAGTLAVAAAVAVLMVTRLFSLLQVDGISMVPTFKDDEYVVLRRTKDVGAGDIIGFYYEGKILLKRAVGIAGDYIDIDEDGNVSVNGKVIVEPYLTEKKLGKCEVGFPYKVPEDSFFVLGDNRAVSLDSRLEAIGSVQRKDIAGKVVLKVWPLR